MRRGKSKTKGFKAAPWSKNQKLQAVITYLALGNMHEAAIATGIPYPTIRVWKYQDWFKELVTQIRDEDIQQLDSNLQRVAKKSIIALEDRIDNGDVQYDPKTGKLIKIPIKAHVALKISTELLTKQDKLREKPEKREIEKTIDDRLLKLSEEFQKFARSKTVEGTAVVLSTELSV
jgi:hypothetical protein